MADLSTAEQLIITRTALGKARLKAHRVEQLATTGSDYAMRAAARVQLEDVTAEVARLEAELAILEAAAEREATIARLGELARAAAHQLTDVEAVQAEIDQILLPLLERYSAAQQRQRSTRAEFFDMLSTLAPEVRRMRADQTAPRAILAELEAAGVNVAGVLTKLDNYERSLDRPYRPACRFPGALATALREEATRRLGHALPPGVVSITLPDRKEVTVE
jgi:hypothetical protein